MDAAAPDLQLDRVADIAGGLPEDDGLRVFLDVYRTVTTAVLVDAPAGTFEDPEFLHALGAVATQELLDAITDDAAGRPVAARAWRPLLAARRSDRIAKLQFALAGMNAHINRDLPLGVVAVMDVAGIEPNRDTPQHRDYGRVDERFAGAVDAVKARLRDELVGLADDALGRVDDVVAIWSVARARSAAWTNAEALWHLRSHAPLRDAFVASLDRVTGLGSRALLSARSDAVASRAMAGELEGKVALVAGATRGAGRGIAVALGEAGATVYCTGRTTREQRSSTTGRRRSRRPPSRSPPRAAPASPSRSTISSPTRSPRSCAASMPSRAAWTCWSTTSGAASGCSSGTRRCGSTTSTPGCGSCAWRSRRTSSRATTRCRCSSAAPAASSSR